MCEQQRCISVQRSIHRVEVNARPYSGSRKERKDGRVGGNREEKRGGASRSREREGQGGRAEGTGAEWKKMNKHPAKDGGGELPRSASVRTLSLSLSSPLFFSLPLLSSLSFPPSLWSSLFLDCPSVSLYDAPPAAATGFLLPERFPLNVKTRSSTARSLLSPSPSCLSFSARLISRMRTSIIRAL